ncbi:hypothetical protein [Bifidobacterium callimiconis]|uniref:Uncharacterized protein n=1 Tax=Bifidobacterium callimiconis TaxID=2306973 RepID=A0A430FEA8_9BIFI|nr:hypothetical protein [Bifidobacterium callimiconis]MBT1177271.1 hypothetical protein [Bifidobacterium callimiconis]RSX51179.1 hypothetical protein D2E23_1024 [Bifidobacterium callimiconis]
MSTTRDPYSSRFPADCPVHIRSVDDVIALERYLRRRSRRERPLVVMTHRKDGDDLAIDPRSLLDDFDIDVAILDTVDVCRQLTSRIGKERSVFGGAVRVYPSTAQWWKDDNFRASKLILNIRVSAKAFEYDVRDAISRQIALERQAHKVQQSRLVTNVAPTITTNASNATGHVDAADVSGTSAEDSAINVGGASFSTADAVSPNVSTSSTGTTAPGNDADDNRVPLSAPAASTEPEGTLVTAAIRDKADGTVHLVREDQAEELAEYLTDPERRIPVVVATRTSSTHRPVFDTESLARELESTAIVFELDSAKTAWNLTAALPTDAQVYGGMLRAYPPDLEWVDDPSRLGGPYGGFTEEQRKIQRRQLIDDAEGMVARAYSTIAPTVPEQTVPVTATVIGVYPQRGIARLVSGAMASVILPAETDGIPVPADRMLARGQVIHGEFSSRDRMITGLAVRVGKDAIADYAEGDTVLGRIDTVRMDYCMVTLYPGVKIMVEAADALGDAFGEHEDLRLLLDPGTVLPMLIVARGTEQNDWLVSFVEADKEHIKSAPAMIDGGPAWLQPADQGVLKPNADDRQRAIVIDADTDVRELIPEDAGEDAAEMIMTLAAQIGEEQRANEKMRAELDTLQRQNGSLREDAMSQRRARIYQGQQYRTLRGLFRNDKERLLFERDRFDMWIREAWALRFPAADKKHRQLPEHWDYTSEFFDSLEKTQINRQRVVDAALEVLTGIAQQSKSRRCHRLRTGSGAEEAFRVGPHGEKVWRIYLDQGHSARRLHYYEDAKGQYTFASVGVHDDDLR